jgi:hypothetical protein
MRTFSFCVRLAFVVFFVVSFSFYIYSIKVEDISIVNSTNFVSQNPFFVFEMALGIENRDEGIEVEHEHVIFEFSLGRYKKKFVLGEDLLFERVGANKVRVFVPSSVSLKLGKDYNLRLRVSEGHKEVFKKDFVVKASSVSNIPYIFTNNLENVYISKSLSKSYRFFFYYDKPLEVYVVKGSEVISNVKSYEDLRFKNLYYFDYSFSEPGYYRFVVGDCSFGVSVSFDTIPPSFELLYPTNNSVFYRTNKVAFKWSDPVDFVGVDKANSFLKIYYQNNLFTNVNLAYLNKESIVMPYEVCYFDLPGEGIYVAQLSYSDFDGNFTNVFINFSVKNSSEDKEKPRILNVAFEGAKVVSNEVRLARGRVLVNVRVDDGIYGSGVKKVVYRYGNETSEMLVFGDFVQFFVDIASSGVFEVFCEDFAGNKSDTFRYEVVVK